MARESGKEGDRGRGREGKVDEDRASSSYDYRVDS